MHANQGHTRGVARPSEQIEALRKGLPATQLKHVESLEKRGWKVAVVDSWVTPGEKSYGYFKTSAGEVIWASAGSHQTAVETSREFYHFTQRDFESTPRFGRLVLVRALPDEKRGPMRFYAIGWLFPEAIESNVSRRLSDTPAAKRLDSQSMQAVSAHALRQLSFSPELRRKFRERQPAKHRVKQRAPISHRILRCRDIEVSESSMFNETLWHGRGEEAMRGALARLRYEKRVKLDEHLRIERFDGKRWEKMEPSQAELSAAGAATGRR